MKTPLLKQFGAAFFIMLCTTLKFQEPKWKLSVYLNTDYRWIELGTTGFGLLPVAGNAPAYAVEITTVNAEENTAELVAQKLASAKTESKRAVKLHPLNTDDHVIRVTVVFADFEVAALKIS